MALAELNPSGWDAGQIGRLPAGGAAEGSLLAALGEDPENASAWRSLGRVYAERGNLGAAVEALERAAALEPENLLVRYELAMAYSASGETGRALPLYRSLLERFPHNGVLKEAETADQLIGFLEAGLRQVEGGDPIAAMEQYRRALAVRPGDLFARAYLARALAAAGNDRKAAETGLALRRFTLSADPRPYGRYLPGLLPFLVEQGFLKSRTLHQIASFMLWQGVLGPAIPLLDLLTRECPGQKATWLLRAELCFRQGRHGEAVPDLERAVAIDPRDVDAEVRLGRALERDRPEAALVAYQRALDSAPDYAPALRGAATVLDRRGQSAEARSLRDCLAAVSDDRSLIAARLGVELGDVETKPTPLANSEFAAGRSGPEGWRWIAWMGGHFGDACYVGGADRWEGLAGGRSLRITGLWAERRPESGDYWLEERGWKGLARAGYWAPRVVLEGCSLYALSLSYRTANWRSGNVRVGMAVDGRGSGPSDSLSETGGRWQRRVLLFANPRPVAVAVRPLLTNWGVGDLWFDEVRLSRVMPAPGVVIQTVGLPEIK